MSSDATGVSQFSTVLRRAIDESHLSLAHIVSQLSERGYKISRTTLSQWQTGASSPRRTSSKMLIAALEDILSVPPQSLVSLLDTTDTSAPTSPLTHPQPHPQSTSARNQNGSVPIYVDTTNEKYFHTFFHQVVDPAHEAIREATEEHMRISADFRTTYQSLSNLVRIPNSDNPALHITAWWTKDDIFPDEDDIGIYDIVGAHVTSVQARMIDGDLAKIIRLEFPDYVKPGHLHNVSYKIVFHSDKPVRETTERIFSKKLRHYSCSVTFEGKAPPVLQYVLTHTDTENSDVSHKTTVREMLPHNGSAQMTLENVEYGTGLFRWH